jgi:hypothetical protein
MPSSRKITLLNDAIVSIKINTVYKLLISKEYIKAQLILRELLYIMNCNVENDMEPVLYNTVYNNIARACIDCAFGRYTNVSSLVRDTHYQIENRYIPTTSGMVMV